MAFPAPLRYLDAGNRGEMAEWPNAPVLKTGSCASGTGVRIPLSPPFDAFAPLTGSWQAARRKHVVCPEQARFSGFSTPWKFFWRIFHAMEKVFPHCGKTGPIFPRCGKSGFFPRVRPVIRKCASPLGDRCGLGGSPISRLPPPGVSLHYYPSTSCCSCTFFVPTHARIQAEMLIFMGKPNENPHGHQKHQKTQRLHRIGC